MGDSNFGINVHVDMYDMRSFINSKRLLLLDDEGRRLAVWRSIDDTLKHMRSDISKKIRARYFVKKAELDKGIKMYGTMDGPHRDAYGRLGFQGFENPPLSKFEPQVRKNKKGKFTAVSVRVLKANRRRYIKPGGIHKIVATSKGRAAVWMAKGEVMARTEEADHPVILYGPSFMAFFRLTGVADALNAETQRYFRQRLTHHMDYYWKKGF